jgi:hypothetical protein
MNALTEGLVTVLLAIVGLAALSVVLSRNSTTQGVIQAGASGVGNMIGAATASITGEDLPISFAYPNSLGFGFGS